MERRKSDSTEIKGPEDLKREGVVNNVRNNIRTKSVYFSLAKKDCF